MRHTSSQSSPFKRVSLISGLTLALIIFLSFFLKDNASVWLKAFHVIAIISWMAGLLYLPRLMIYHCGVEVGSPQSETFKVMEQRLLTIIMTPAMIISWILGLWLAWKSDFFGAPWFHGKLFLALCLSAVHGHFSVAARRFKEDKNQKSAFYWRMMNEVPTILMVGIVILVIVKPFN